MTLLRMSGQMQDTRASARQPKDAVPRSLCHAITNLSRLTGEAGRQLIKPSVLAVRCFLSNISCPIFYMSVYEVLENLQSLR
jgi:hypothetical protein